MRLNTLNSLAHLLNASDTDELNTIQHSPYTMSDEELIQSRIQVKNGLNILSLNCQSLHAIPKSHTIPNHYHTIPYTEVTP